ncbi:MAG: DUF4845 domain-containing protein [Thiohalophilus sp.]
MHAEKRQHGMSIPGWIIIIVFAGLLGLFGLKVVPVFINSMTITSILSGMEEDPELRAASPGMLQTTFVRRLNVNRITDVSVDDVYIEQQGKFSVVEVEYEVRKNFIANIDIVISFNKRAEIPRS